MRKKSSEKYHCDFKYIKENIKVSKISPLDNIDELINMNKIIKLVSLSKLM